MSSEHPFLAAERRIMGDIYTSGEALENLVTLCDECGSRFAGSPEERQAAAFMRDRLTAYGLQDARLEEFEYNGWERGEAELTLLAPVERALECISLPMSPPAALEAELIDLQDGHPEAFARAGERLRGNIALVGARPPRGLARTMHRTEKYERAALAGAAAFLYVGQYPGYGPETGSVAFDRTGYLPALSVSRETGEYLRRLLERRGQARLRLRTTDRPGRQRSFNVVAELPGNRWPDEWVIVGSHYDGHDIAQGALDPASGTVSVLEAARALAAQAADQLGCGVRFIAFGAEEVGLIGSYRYVAAHRETLDGVRFMLNLDMGGRPGRKGIVLNRWPEVETRFAEWARQMAVELPLGQRASAFSDHYPFFLEGVPSGWFLDPDEPPSGRGWGHSRHDTVDKVHLNDLRECAGLAARLALRIAGDAEWPARRRSAAEVTALEAAETELEGQRVHEEMERLYAARG